MQDDVVADGKDASVDTNQKEMEKLMPYIIILIVLVVLAVLSTLIVNFAKPQSCSSIFQQQDYSCLQQEAYATSNAQLCSSLPSYYSNQCYLSIGENTKNESVCNMASDANVFSQCTIFVANATMNAGLCNNLEQGQIAACVDQIALEELMPNLCRRLADGNSRSLCLNAVYFNSAVSRLNASYCRAMSANGNLSATFASLDLAAASGKYNYVNITDLLDYAAFSNVSVGPRDACYISLAYFSLNSSYCNYVSNQTSSLCNLGATHFDTLSQNKTKVVNYTAFMNSCSQTETFAECNNTIGYMTALADRNVTKCGELPTSYAYQCYYGLAQEYNTTSYCSYIKNATLNNECVLSISSGYLNNQNNSVG